MYWHQRGMFMLHLTHEAQARAKRAWERCQEEGIAEDELVAAAPADLTDIFSVPARGRTAMRGKTPHGAAGVGGFAFFYAESGYDLDADGDVDGGLRDALTGGGEGGTLLDGLSDLFD